jgi:hypothetical protein
MPAQALELSANAAANERNSQSAGVGGNSASLAQPMCRRALALLALRCRGG